MKADSPRLHHLQDLETLLAFLMKQTNKQTISVQRYRTGTYGTVHISTVCKRKFPRVDRNSCLFFIL